MSYHQGCPLPPRIAHGHHKRINTYSIFKPEVAYECDEGYSLVGQARLTCGYSHWSPEAPQCKGNFAPFSSHDEGVKLS